MTRPNFQRSHGPHIHMVGAWPLPRPTHTHIGDHCSDSGNGEPSSGKAHSPDGGRQQRRGINSHPYVIDRRTHDRYIYYGFSAQERSRADTTRLR